MVRAHAPAVARLLRMKYPRAHLNQYGIPIASGFVVKVVGEETRVTHNNLLSHMPHATDKALDAYKRLLDAHPNYTATRHKYHLTVERIVK